MPGRKGSAVQGTAMRMRLVCALRWMEDVGWSTPAAECTFRKIRRIAMLFAARARTTQCVGMEQTKRFRVSLSGGREFRLPSQKTGSREKALLTLSAATTDISGWQILSCIGVRCSKFQVIYGLYGTSRSGMRNIK